MYLHELIKELVNVYNDDVEELVLKVLEAYDVDTVKASSVDRFDYDSEGDDKVIKL